MPGKIGNSTIYTTIIPNYSYLRNNIYFKRLSKDAKRRLAHIDYYYHHGENKSLVCRHFNISRSYLDKWLKRFNPKKLGTLESRSKRPHHVRDVSYSYELVLVIKEYRENPDTCYYSAKKLATVFHNEYDEEFHVSPATIGRIIKRRNFFFHPITTLVHRNKRAEKSWSELKRRKPAGLKATGPRQVIEFDMKHISLYGQKYYAMCAIDEYTKEAVVHVAKHCNSRQARIALEKAIAVFGKDVVILNDNGSENLGEAWEYLAEHNIIQYFAHARAPKEKPVVERFIGSLDRECLMVHRNDIHSLEDLDYYITRWLNNYHFMRPHDSLEHLDNEFHKKYILYTPAEFCATMDITIEARKVYSM